jgi:hypothetical protein
VAWIVVAIVGGVVALGVTLTFLLTYVRRRCRCRKHQLPRPYLAEDELLKRRKMSVNDAFREEEERRAYMIRKSLATRSTDSAGSGFSAVADHIDRELVELERRESASLKSDWKRWEARVRQERCVPGVQHPAVNAASAASGQVPILAIPKPVRHRSLSRAPLVRHVSTPPVPPRHPGRRRPS